MNLSGSGHDVILLKRRIISLGMIIVCLGIALSPIAMSALKSPRLAHAITGECAGDCNVCGCSPASRASRTCCCWIKISKRAEMPKQDQTGCCDTPPAQSTISAKTGGCSLKPAAKPVPEMHGCNMNNKQNQHGDNQTTPARYEKDTAAATVFKCGCPCDSGNHPAFWGGSKSEMLPFAFNSSIKSPQESVALFQSRHHMVSCYSEPPDPPPKLMISA